MKISFPVIRGGSGSDVFTANLVAGLDEAGVKANIKLINPICGFFPSFAGLRFNPDDSDIIHANTWNGYAFKKEIPLIVTEYHVVHDPILGPYKSSAQKIYHHLIYRNEEKSLACADQVTSISRYTQKMLEKVFGYCDSTMIYCGIDTDLFKPQHTARELYRIDESKIILLYVGNLSRRKGADLLVPIMNDLGEQFVLLTTTGLRNEEPLTHDNIISLGKLTPSDLVNAYNICDIFLFPSRLEGFGLSVAEAMACGKPVITTNCSSLPELIEDDKGGILCEMDDVSGFSDAVRYLSDQEDIRNQMGRYNVRRVKDMFSSKEMVKKHINLYKKQR